MRQPPEITVKLKNLPEVKGIFRRAHDLFERFPVARCPVPNPGMKCPMHIDKRFGCPYCWSWYIFKGRIPTHEDISSALEGQVIQGPSPEAQVFTEFDPKKHVISHPTCETCDLRETCYHKVGYSEKPFTGVVFPTKYRHVEYCDQHTSLKGATNAQ